MLKFFFILGALICFKSSALSQYLEISCDRPVLVYNDHVGNEWAHAFELDEKFYAIDNPLIIQTSSAYKVKFVTSEANEKYPDSSAVPLGIDPSKLEWEKAYSKTLELIVKERNGRYAGNTAKWQVTVHFRKLHNRT